MNDLVIIDLETTGSDINRDEIIQFAGTKLGGYEEDMNIYIKPSIPISDDAYAVHGLSSKDLKNEPTISDVIGDIVNYIKGCSLAGYNITGFDIHILLRELVDYGYFSAIDDITKRPIVDAFNMEIKLTPRTLEATYKRYTGKDIDNAHDAHSDIKATKAVILNQMKYAGVNSADEFEKFYLDGKKRCDIAGKFYKDSDGIKFNFGKYKDALVVEHLDYIDWMLSKDFSYETVQFIQDHILGK